MQALKVGAFAGIMQGLIATGMVTTHLNLKANEPTVSIERFDVNKNGQLDNEEITRARQQLSAELEVLNKLKN